MPTADEIFQLHQFQKYEPLLRGVTGTYRELTLRVLASGQADAGRGGRTQEASLYDPFVLAQSIDRRRESIYTLARLDIPQRPRDSHFPQTLRRLLGYIFNLMSR
jgi:hypothetical protein